MSDLPSASSLSSRAAEKAANVSGAVKVSRQGHMCMWHGLTVAGLLRMIGHRPDTSLAYAPRWLSIAILGMVNSLENAVERLLYERRIQRTRIDCPPLFILGHWRSGTTLLHNLLTLDSHVTFPNLYQCMFPGHFLLTESVVAPLTRWLLPVTRPMDNVPVGWKEPQEEDVAMALSCGISPYLMTAFHDRPELYGRYFDPRDMTDEEREIWKSSYLRLMKKLTLRKNASIISKNPANTFRIPILQEMFPEARFVYIRRDPYAVYQSTMHLRRTMFTENALGKPRLQTSHEDTLHFYEKCVRTYETDKSLIPAGRLTELRFEDLEANPVGEIENIYQSLGLPGWEAVEPKLRAQLPSLKSYRKNAFRMDATLKRTVYRRLQWIFELYDYPSRISEEEMVRLYEESAVGG